MNNRMIVNVWVVYPHDCVVACKLQLTAATQHHKRALYHMLLAQEKIKIQILKYGFYGMRIIFKPL